LSGWSSRVALLRTAFFARALIALATLPVRLAAESASASQRDGGQDVVIRAAAGIAGIVKADRWVPS
jgi:hypothetical protein